MGSNSKIEWTDATWNPVRGCSRVSEGCRHCFAERQAIRMAGPGGAYEGLVRSTAGGPRWTGAVVLDYEKLQEPLRWRKPRRIFVNSMSDLFHEALPDDAIDQVFGAIAASGAGHVFQILTKRAERMQRYMSDPGVLERIWPHAERFFRWHPRREERWLGADVVAEHVRAALSWPFPNVWLGVSVENQVVADKRIRLLLDTPAAVRWISAEPLLGPLNLVRWLCPAYTACKATARPELLAQIARAAAIMGGAQYLDWVVVGGETGPGARPLNLEWIESIAKQCQIAGVAVFVKQDSGPRAGGQGRLPSHLWALKEYPIVAGH